MIILEPVVRERYKLFAGMGLKKNWLPAESGGAPNSGISKKGIVNDAENLRCAIGAGR